MGFHPSLHYMNTYTFGVESPVSPSQPNLRNETPVLLSSSPSKVAGKWGNLLAHRPLSQDGWNSSPPIASFSPPSCPLPTRPTYFSLPLSFLLSPPLLLSNHSPLAAPLKFFCPIWEECYPRGKTEWSHNRAFSNSARLLLLRVAEECHPPPSTTMSSGPLHFAQCVYVCQKVCM